MKTIKKLIQGAGQVIVVLVMLDILILFTGLAQIAMEGRTGYWNPFWRWQAQQVIRLVDR